MQRIKQFKPKFTQRRHTMKRLMPVILAMILTLSAFRVPSVLAAPAPPAGTRVLIALLSGPAIDGVVPSGKAEFAASQASTSLFVDMSSLNLPDFTCLDAVFGRFLVQGISVRSGRAFLFLDSSVIPSLTVRPGEVITFSIGVPPVDQTQCGGILGGPVLAPATGTVILSGTFQAP